MTLHEKVKELVESLESEYGACKISILLYSDCQRSKEVAVEATYRLHGEEGPTTRYVTLDKSPLNWIYRESDKLDTSIFYEYTPEPNDEEECLVQS